MNKLVKGVLFGALAGVAGYVAYHTLLTPDTKRKVSQAVEDVKNTTLSLLEDPIQFALGAAQKDRTEKNQEWVAKQWDELGL